MRLLPTTTIRRLRCHAASAFSIIESVIGLCVLAIMFAIFFAGLSQSISIVQLARENLRATQIMTEKMDTLRLYTWAQVNSNGFILTNFTAVFSPMSNLPPKFVTGGSGITYTGTISISPSGFTESYSNSMRQVKITLKWKSGNVLRQTDMTTFVSQYGMQNYIY